MAKGACEMTARRISMTEEEVSALVENAVLKALDRVGLKVDDPEHQFEATADFRWVRASRQDPELARTLAFADKLRRAVDGSTRRVGVAVILALFSAVVWLLMQGANFWKTH